MAPVIVFNSNCYRNMKWSEEKMKASNTTTRVDKREDAGFPGNEFLDILWFQDTDDRSSRVSVASRTSLGPRKCIPNINSKRMGEAFRIATGSLDVDGIGFKQEIDDLVRVALKNEGLKNGINRTVSVRRPEQGYKLLVSVESRNDERKTWWPRKDTFAVCITIFSLRGRTGPMGAEKGEEQVPLMFSCGKACVIWTTAADGISDAVYEKKRVPLET